MPVDARRLHPLPNRCPKLTIGPVVGLLKADQMDFAARSQFLEIGQDLALPERLKDAIVGNVEKLHRVERGVDFSQRRTAAVRRSNSHENAKAMTTVMQAVAA